MVILACWYTCWTKNCLLLLSYVLRSIQRNNLCASLTLLFMLQVASHHSKMRMLLNLKRKIHSFKVNYWERLIDVIEFLRYFSCCCCCLLFATMPSHFDYDCTERNWYHELYCNIVCWHNSYLCDDFVSKTFRFLNTIGYVWYHLRHKCRGFFYKWRHRHYLRYR